MTESLEQLRSQVEAEAEALKQLLTADSGEVLRILESMNSKLRRHFDALNELTTRCLDVNTIYLLFSYHHPQCGVVMFLVASVRVCVSSVRSFESLDPRALLFVRRYTSWEYLGLSLIHI